MNRSAGFLLITLFLIPSCGGGGGGDGPGEVLLATIQHGFGGSASSSTPQVAMFLKLGPSGSEAQITPELANGETGVHTTLAGDDATLDAVFAQLTNGVNESLSRGISSVPSGNGGGSTVLESAMLQNVNPALTGPDLAGATLTRIEVDVDQLDFQNGPPTFSFTSQSVIRFFGTVP